MEFALAALVVLAVVAFVVLPLVRGIGSTADATDTQAAAQERAAIYQELIELELDQRVGKVSEADFREQSDILLARAASLISQEDVQQAAADEQVEREIAAVRATLNRPTAAARRTESTGEPRA